MNVFFTLIAPFPGFDMSMKTLGVSVVGSVSKFVVEQLVTEVQY